MRLARVIGTVVPARRVDSLLGVRLLIVEPLDETLQSAGAPFVAADTVSAGPGETVLLAQGREAALALEEPFNPVDAAAVGIVDAVDLD